MWKMYRFSIEGTHAPLTSELSYKVTSSLWRLRHWQNAPNKLNFMVISTSSKFHDTWSCQHGP